MEFELLVCFASLSRLVSVQLLLFPFGNLDSVLLVNQQLEQTVLCLFASYLDL